jgi:oligopeptidase B
MRVQILLGLLTMGLFQACNKVDEPATLLPLQQLSVAAPKAQTIPYQANYHGIILNDDYYWLKDQNYPEVNDKPILDYLKAENDYYAKFLAPHTQLVDKLFEEFKGRIDETNTSVPWQKNGYEYRWFYRDKEDYRTWARRKLDSQDEEIFLDETQLAADFEYFSLNDLAISPDNRYLAYSVDTDGSERSIIKIKDLVSNEYLKDELADSAGELLFSQDSQSLIYAKLQQDKWRVESINLHKLGTQQAEDKILVTELDESFSLGFDLTSSEHFLVLNSSDSDRAEVSVIAMDDLNQKPQFISTREQNFLLKVDHGNGYFYMLSNDKHVNFSIAKTPEDKLQRKQWQSIFAGSDSRYFTDLQVFKDFLVVNQSINGLQSLTIMPNGEKPYEIDFPEKVASVYMSNNPEFSQSHLRLHYESMITPDTVFDFDTKTKDLTARKERKIPSGYDKSQYQTERIMAPARDGAQVPVTLVYKKGIKKDQSNPVYLYGYGAYASGISPDFSVIRLSLLDRGLVFAYGHVRGGDELGYQWYLDGKLDKRTNTFNDFVDVAKHLVAENYTSNGNISISGGSAGGELVGAAVIQSPAMWRSATLSVPFVDVLNTMLDASLPLTPPEWGEWGNPIESKDVFELIKSYSPYDNIVARDYPPMLVTGGLNDPRVTYWEPAKWTAKMRATKTDNNLLVMRMNMGAGHFANSGRYGRLRDYAEEYAFTLLAHGITE